MMSRAFVPCVSTTFVLALFLGSVPCILGYAGFTTELATFATGFSGSPSADFNGAFVPANRTVINIMWRNEVSNICGSFGDASPSMTEANADTWTNDGIDSNSDAQSLYDLATGYRGLFQSFVESVASEVSAAPSFGPNNSNIQKTVESLQEKINNRVSDNLPNPAMYIDDSLRATLIVNTPALLENVISALKSKAQSGGHLIAFDNKFVPSLNSLAGYVGIHATVYFEQKLLTEVQIHLFNIYDGTLQCPKQYSHNIYKVVNTTGTSPTQITEAANGYMAMKFAFVFGMQRADPTRARRSVNVSRRSTCPLPLTGFAYVFDAGLLVRYNASATLAMDIAMSYWQPSDSTWVAMSLAEADDVLQSGYAISSSEANKLMSNSGTLLYASTSLLLVTISVVTVYFTM